MRLLQFFEGADQLHALLNIQHNSAHVRCWGYAYVIVIVPYRTWRTGRVHQRRLRVHLVWLKQWRWPRLHWSWWEGAHVLTQGVFDGNSPDERHPVSD